METIESESVPLRPDRNKLRNVEGYLHNSKNRDHAVWKVTWRNRYFQEGFTNAHEISDTAL